MLSTHLDFKTHIGYFEAVGERVPLSGKHSEESRLEQPGNDEDVRIVEVQR